MRDAATERQIQAARPGASTWLTANAGSGKTKVLTDRVARLLLDETPPQNILCLTFTKAAASEMQNRLFRRLGEWAMAPEPALLDKLADLGLDTAPPPDRLARARTLFARAVETPGGLKIQTIHSFCASILRRFPLEAGVPPNFSEMDDRAGQALMAGVLSDLAAADPGAIRGIAPHLGGQNTDAFLRDIVSARTAFAPALTRDEICEVLDLDPSLTEDGVAAQTFTGTEWAFLEPLATLLASGKATDQKLAAKIADLGPPDGAGALAAYATALLNKDGSIPKRAATKDIVEAAPDLVDELTDLRERVFDAQDRLKLVRVADRSAALHRFADAFLTRFAAAKAARGWLDFDDLILKTRDLLATPGLADWVLYRLDGAIDHILVDEAQDTSPAQWQVVGLLAEEIAAGKGRTEAGQRTLFVVGDRKQSIYSFQGADPQEFERMRLHFEGALRATTGLVNLEMEYSFRSAPPILGAVDTALSGHAGLGGNVSHIAFHETMPGRVDLWPVAQSDEGADDVPWFDPTDRVLPSDATAKLARGIARHIRGLIDTRTPIQDQKGRIRALTEGDVLILFRARSALFDATIAACKHEGLAIAGADRMKLAAELAVRDICAMLAFLATPEDDLSLAAVLRSPLLAWSEDDLYRLAQPRPGFLWQSLRGREDAPDTLALLHDMLDQAEYLRPYELIERLLIRHHGRARLLARLGPEAEDGIDVLLTQALTYETADVPSLTGFLDWLSAEDIAVKRQADQAGGKIRVMTVHGAKGLESPVVILPDTIRRPRGIDDTLLDDPEGNVLWKPRTDEMPLALEDAIERAREKDQAEEERLLYVAMTRAESWLIVAGAWGAQALPETCWYAKIEAAMPQLAAGPLETPLGEGRRVEFGPWPAAAPATAPPPQIAVALPDWLNRPLPRPDPASKVISPSDLGGAKALPGEGLATEQALARGTALHLLLEHLPGLPGDRRAQAAAALLPDLAEDDRAALLGEAAAILDREELRMLFGPGSLAEVPVTARLDALGGRAISGVIDRLVPGPDEVLIVDYKSNTMLPDLPEDTPEGLLRQMGAYADAVAKIYPGRRIVAAILWTRAARLDRLPAALATAALARAEVS